MCFGIGGKLFCYHWRSWEDKLAAFFNRCYCADNFEIMGINIKGFRSDNKPRVRGLIIGSRGWRGQVYSCTHTYVCT